MSETLVERLRHLAKLLGTGHFDLPGHFNEAADTIERQAERVKALEEALRYVEPFLAYAWQEGGARLSRRAKECSEKVGAALQGTGT